MIGMIQTWKDEDGWLGKVLRNFFVKRTSPGREKVEKSKVKQLMDSTPFSILEYMLHVYNFFRI